MDIAILETPSQTAAQVVEILEVFGIFNHTMVEGGIGDAGDAPLIIVPAGARLDIAEALSRVEAGGHILALVPDEALLSALDIESMAMCSEITAMRVVRGEAPGFAGKCLPIVVNHCKVQCSEESVQAYLHHYDDPVQDRPAFSIHPCGKGTFSLFHFDLVDNFYRLRQGDPERVGKHRQNRDYSRATDLAYSGADFSDGDIPYADLLARYFIHVIEGAMPLPLPLVSPFPGEAAMVILHKGDEDYASLDERDTQFREMNDADAPMNLYIIPEETHSTHENITPGLGRHALGPHANLRKVSEHSVPDQMVEFERQIRLFEENFSYKAKSVSNHCLIWSGYTDMVEVLERCEIGMDTNFINADFLGGHRPGLYHHFGSAMPVKFRHLDGHLSSVYQQPFHLEDDTHFAMHIDYSFKWSPEIFKPLIRRWMEESATRYHVPIAMCIHPQNRGYSGAHFDTVIELCREMEVPIMHFDEWLDFQEARRRQRPRHLTWQNDTLTCELAEDAMENLSLALPECHGEKSLTSLSLNGEPLQAKRVNRHDKIYHLFTLPKQAGTLRVDYT